MPTYEYLCKKCGHSFDISQPITDDALEECPECSETALRRVYGVPVVRLLGGGYYSSGKA